MLDNAVCQVIHNLLDGKYCSGYFVNWWTCAMNKQTIKTSLDKWNCCKNVAFLSIYILSEAYTQSEMK